MANIMKKAGTRSKRPLTSLVNSLNKAGVSDVAYEIASIGVMAKEQGDLSLALKAFSELMQYQYAKKKAVDHKIEASAKMPNIQIVVSGDAQISSSQPTTQKKEAVKKSSSPKIEKSEPLDAEFSEVEEKEPVPR